MDHIVLLIALAGLALMAAALVGHPRSYPLGFAVGAIICFVVDFFLVLLGN